MKNQLDNIVTSDSCLLDSYPLDSQSKIPHCLFNKPSTHVCSNKVCLEDAFICTDDSCDCNKKHQECPQLSIKSIIKTIRSKFVPLGELEELIMVKIDKIIDDLSELKEKFSLQFKQDLHLYGLTTNDKKFFTSLQNLNTQKLTGQNVFQMFNSIMNSEKTKHQKDFLKVKINKICQCINQEIRKQSQDLIKMFQPLKENKSFETIPLFENSKVIATEDMIERLRKMFDTKTIKSAKMLYRASQNNFSGEQFHEICDNIPHTLTLCETEYGKIIGGYTPLIWKTGKKQVKDDTGTSFIFSLTNNHRFKLNKQKTAIYQYTNFGPYFGDGNPDFYIANHANENNNSWGKINRSYSNENYKQQCEESWYKFNGDPQKSYSFKVKEWQVWELKFIE